MWTAAGRCGQETGECGGQGAGGRGGQGAETISS